MLPHLPRHLQKRCKLDEAWWEFIENVSLKKMFLHRGSWRSGLIRVVPPSNEVHKGLGVVVKMEGDEFILIFDIRLANHFNKT